MNAHPHAHHQPLIVIFKINKNNQGDEKLMNLPIKIVKSVGDGNPKRALNVTYSCLVREMDLGVKIVTVVRDQKEVYALLPEKQDPQEILNKDRGEFANESIAKAIREDNYFLVDARNGAIFSDDRFMLHDVLSAARLRRLQINSQKHLEK